LQHQVGHRIGLLGLNRNRLRLRLGFNGPGLGRLGLHRLHVDRPGRLHAGRLDRSGGSLGWTRARHRARDRGNRSRRRRQRHHRTAEHRRRMTAGLQEQRIDQNRNNGRRCQHARDEVLRTVQQQSQH
ncbi:hypothetical protein chiPu_0028654, partial [Chiloscyllium punctatum]|nr:hypothetical protein [Chiloscyllium punctatum]